MKWHWNLIEGVKDLSSINVFPIFIWHVFVFQVCFSPCFVHTEKYTPYQDVNYCSFIVKFSFISLSSVLIPLLYHPLQLLKVMNALFYHCVWYINDIFFKIKQLYFCFYFLNLIYKITNRFNQKYPYSIYISQRQLNTVHQ